MGRHYVKVPQMPWYGDTELEIDFPESWDVEVAYMHGHNAPPLNDEGIRKAFANPIGSRPIRELAKGKKEVAIVFDDMTRPTPSAVVIPYVLEELAAAGIPDDNIRFISAPGTHGKMNGIELRKKLGEEVMGRFMVYNHNPYENCTPVGFTSRGTPVQINSEFMSCDLKIAIGALVPHPLVGFGGGAKIIVPGVTSMETILANHVRNGLFSPSTPIGIIEGNAMTQDNNEAARMVGLDVKIDTVINLKREITALFVGDVVAEYEEGVKLAEDHYATDMIPGCDICVANCWAKGNEMGLALRRADPLLASGKAGEMVLLVTTPEGQINHYLCKRFGKKFGGRAWIPRTTLPPNTKRLTIMQSYADRAGVEWIAPLDSVEVLKTWDEVISVLESRYTYRVKVAVIPDGTIQYFPAASASGQSLRSEDRSADLAITA